MGIFCTSSAFAQQTTANAGDSTQTAQGASPFPDVPANQWAYDAVRQLAVDGYIQGYPDGQFKGQRPMTRYEMAVLTDRSVRSIEAKMTQLAQVEQRDIAAVRALLNGFRPELAQIHAQIAALQQKTDDQQNQITNLKNEADATQLRVQQGKVGLTTAYRQGTQTTNVQVFAPTTNGGIGAFLVPGGSTAFLNGPIATVGGAGSNGANYAAGAATPVNTIAYMPGANATTPVGIFAHGTNYVVVRPLFAGQISPRFEYGIRLSARTMGENGIGTSATSPAYCTNLTSISCAYSDINGTQGNIPVNLDYMYLGYVSPGGINARIGRYSVGCCGMLGLPKALLFGGNSYSGLALGYTDPIARLSAVLYYQIPGQSSYNLAQQQTGGATAGIASTPPCTTAIGYNTGQNQPIWAGINPNCNTSGQEVGGGTSYYFPSTGTGVSFEADTRIGTATTYWDPAAVSCGGTLAVNAVTCTTLTTGAPSGKAVTATGGFNGAYLNGWGTSAWVDAGFTQLFGYRGEDNTGRPQFRFEVEMAHHLGSDPFTGAAWAGANTWSSSLTFASKGNLQTSLNSPFSGSGAGNAHSNVAQLWFQYFGLNAGSLPSGQPGGTLGPLINLGFGNWAGTMAMGVNLGTWVTSNVRVSVGLVHAQNIPGVTIPAGSVTGGGACPGCFVNQINVNTGYLETFFNFL